MTSMSAFEEKQRRHCVPVVSRSLRIAAAALVFALATPAHAIVNIEDLRASVPPEGVSGRFDLSGSSQSGNSNSLHVSTGGRINWKRGDTLDFIVASYDFGETSGVRDTNQSLVHIRHVVTLNPTWAWEAFGQVEQDEFRRLNYRGLLGGGLRRTLIHNDDRAAAYLGFGGFYSTEQLTGGGTENLWRANLYLVLKHAIGKHAHFATTTYYQPALKDTSDFRMYEEAGLSVAITKTLDLTTGLMVRYDSRPPTGVRAGDISFSTGIKYRF
jgi:putative salt-induced outer membrane protein YdiY